MKLGGNWTLGICDPSRDCSRFPVPQAHEVFQYRYCNTGTGIINTRVPYPGSSYCKRTNHAYQQSTKQTIAIWPYCNSTATCMLYCNMYVICIHWVCTRVPGSTRVPVLPSMIHAMPCHALMPYHPASHPFHHE